MDLRVKKTERAIRNAFYQLVQTKPVEKITVKELSELAEINKTTFYAHYETIYDLVATLEQEITDMVIQNIDEFQVLFDNPREFVFDLYQVFTTYRTDNLAPFNPSSQDFARKLGNAICNEACRRKVLPEQYKNLGMLLTFLINGLFGLSKSNPDSISDSELDYLATFVEGGIRALPYL